MRMFARVFCKPYFSTARHSPGAPTDWSQPKLLAQPPPTPPALRQPLSDAVSYVAAKSPSPLCLVLLVAAEGSVCTGTQAPPPRLLRSSACSLDACLALLSQSAHNEMSRVGQRRSSRAAAAALGLSLTAAPHGVAG